MKVLIAVITILSFTKCGSIKFSKNPPFKITKSSYNHWIGGLPGISGTNVKISYTLNTDVTFDSIYFQKRVVKIQLRESNGTKLLMGYFKNEDPNKKTDYNLHAVVENEVGNKPPTEKNFPFELKENEAVISYKRGNKTKYFKIENIKKEKSMFYPSQAKQ